jgi:hypothetical protein
VSNDPDIPDLDLIMDEIEANTDQPQPTPPSEDVAIEKRTTDDIDDRRQLVWDLRQRGKSYRDISAILIDKGYERGTSISTVKSDIDHMRRKGREQIEFHDREDYLASHVSVFRDIRTAAWSVHDRGDFDQKIKALNLIRQTTNDERKALQDTGVVRKENQVQESVQIGLVAKWDDSDVGVAAGALIASTLNLHLAPSTLDIEDAEIIEEEEENDESITEE